MAGSTWTQYYNSGTSTNTSTVITNATTSGSDYYGIKIYNPEPQLTFKKAARIPTQRSPVKVVKDFWDGVEWKEHTSYVPRKSITDKWIIGKMYKRWRTPEPRMRGKGLGTFKQFANHKELFQEKLKGKA
jgi:hypothetical protein